MIIRQLLDALARLIEADPWQPDRTVAVGADFEPVAGGLIGHRDGLVRLIRAPIRLDKIGGLIATDRIGSLPKSAGCTPREAASVFRFTVTHARSDVRWVHIAASTG